MKTHKPLLLTALCVGCSGTARPPADTPGPEVAAPIEPEEATPAPATSADRAFELEYGLELAAIPASDGPVDVFVPVAPDNEEQRILRREVVSPVEGRIGRELQFGNQFWHAHLEKGTGQPMKITVKYRIRRRPQVNDAFRDRAGPSLSDDERVAQSAWMRATPREPTSDPVLMPIQAEIAPGETSLPVVARAIYDWIVDHVTFDTTGTGAGQGDIQWVATERKGDCTDFHALFVSLARGRGLPARFEMGIPLPVDRPDGEVEGYTCWAQVYLPGAGWVPLDAAEAVRNRARRDELFGSFPADRIYLSVGRDIRLAREHGAAPLTYFVHPYVEVGGVAFEGVTRHVTYREVEVPTEGAPPPAP